MNPIAKIEIQDYGTISVELCPEDAPNTVNNFIALAKSGYYDGLCFHRIIKGFMIQGGCPDGNGTGDAGYKIYGEFLTNGFQNNLKHTAGTLSMARANRPNTAGSQFFIMHKDSPHLDGDYAAFGKVSEGMDIVNTLAELATDYFDKPETPVIMTKVTVDTFDTEYPEPAKI